MNKISWGGVRQRLSWIDSMRGFAILLVVLGHSIGIITDPMNKFILSFHMPVFFFVSGMVANCRFGNEIVPFTDYLIKKAKGILIPQMTLFILNTCFNIAIEHETLSLELILTNAFNWFLAVLFYVTILFWIAEKVGLIQKKVLLLSGLVLLIILTQILNIKTVIHVETIPMAMLFFSCGHYFKTLYCGPDNAYKTAQWQHLWIAAIPMIVICSYWNTPVTMYDNSYGNLLLFGITSICGIWVSYEIGAALKDNTALQWLGKNSIIIYVFHARLLNVLHGLGKKIVPGLTNSNYLYPANWHYFFITMVILVPVVFVCNRYFHFLFGKNKKE